MPLLPRLRNAGLAIVLLTGAAGCTSIPSPITLDPSQATQVQAAQTYLDGLTRFKAHFVQSGWSGGGAGTVWVDRPGRMRLAYARPSAAGGVDETPGTAPGRIMVARDGLFVILDGATGALTTLPVARTPLGLLLAAHVSLTGTVAITEFQQTADALLLQLQDRQNPQQGTLTLSLRRMPMQLRSITATDVHGRSLTLTLDHIDRDPAVTSDLFAYPAAAS